MAFYFAVCESKVVCEKLTLENDLLTFRWNLVTKLNFHLQFVNEIVVEVSINFKNFACSRLNYDVVL